MRGALGESECVESPPHPNPLPASGAREKRRRCAGGLIRPPRRAIKREQIVPDNPAAFDNLTRENVMKVVASMDFEIDTYIPGIRIKTSPTDFYPIEQVQMMRFTGEKWQLFGPIIDGHAE